MFSVNIIGNTSEDMKALDQYDLDLKRRNAYPKDQNIVPGILSEEQIKTVRQAGYTVDIVYNIEEMAERQRSEVSRRNRFANKDAVLRFAENIFKKYMSAEEVESALINISSLYPDIATLIELPNKTWEGRISHAVRLRAGARQDRTGVLFTGSMHAREWGGSDICVNFIYGLLNSYKNHGSLQYGNKEYSAEEVRNILENIDLFVFPDVNPDGKEYSQNNYLAWRKNRNPNGSTEEMKKGVDLNRNFDFLWDSGIETSPNIDSYKYKGSHPFSEPETKNVRYLFDTYTNIGFFLDVHSYSGLILYDWGDDDNQSSDPNQNFLNPEYDGKRGINNDDMYREFMPESDERIEKKIADRMEQALFAAHGNKYDVEQAAAMYPLPVRRTITRLAAIG